MAFRATLSFAGKEFDVLDYGVWFWVIFTVLAILSTVVIVVTA